MAHSGCDRSAEDAYSSVAPDPTFAFVGVRIAAHSILYLPFGLCFFYVLHIFSFAILYFKEIEMSTYTKFCSTSLMAMMS
jgi:hypothetical protein